MKHNIYLTGFMGTGKSTVSRILAGALGFEEIDTDAEIARQQGRSIKEIFAAEGEGYFRSLETGILDDIKNMKPCIVSCGGGMVMRSENVRKIKETGKVVLLSASPETIYLHVKDSTNRPLLNGNMNIPYIKKLMDERMPKYLDAADVVIVTDGLNPKEVADKIVETYLKYIPK